MSNQFWLFEQTGPPGVRANRPVYQEERKSITKPSMAGDVIAPTLLAWALLFVGSLGLGFILVARIGPVFDEIGMMIGIGMAISATVSLLPFGILLDRYNERVWSIRSAEWQQPERSEPIQDYTRVMSQDDRTITLGNYHWDLYQIQKLAVNLLTPAGQWKGRANFARKDIEDIIQNYTANYPIIKGDFRRLGWIDNDGLWTDKGKRELFEQYYPRRTPPL